MKLTYLLAATSGFFGSVVYGQVQDWQIQNLTDVTYYSSTGISEVSFTFYDPNTGLTTECSYENAPGSGRPATVLTYADCDNSNVRFTYIETSETTGQIGIEYFITSESGTLQGVEESTGIADLACSVSVSSDERTCFADDTALVPGTETA